MDHGMPVEGRFNLQSSRQFAAHPAANAMQNCYYAFGRSAVVAAGL